jgi:hypothetical protein
MRETASHNNTSNFINRAQLVRLKLKAMRAGAWYRNLRRIDRVLIDLTIIVTRNNVRSTSLARNIRSVVEKLEALVGSSLQRIIKEVGFPMARRASSLAQKWGHPSANEWSSDLSFASFLAIVSMNEPKTFKS